MPGQWHITKQVPVNRNGEDGGNVTLRFYDDMPSVAYISAADFQELMLPGTTITVIKNGEGDYTLKNPFAEATVNTTDEQFTSANYMSFTNLMGLIQPGMDNAYLDGAPYVRYKSQDEALEEYKETMSNRNAADAVAALDGENPVPASLVIKLNDPQQVEATANKLIADEDFIAVADDPDDVGTSVQYGRETVERLFSVTNYIRIGAIVLVALLTFVAFVFINNTIRLAISARRREIAIERLVGASNGFIRGPFVAEGMLEALIGSILAVAALHFGMGALVPRLENSLQFLSFTLSQRIVLETYAGLVVIGLILGTFGSIIAMRRYLKV